MQKLISLIITVAFLAMGSSVVLARGDAAAGKEKSVACAACHGADGNSQIPMNPVLAGQYADYIVRALMDYKSGARQNVIMAGMAVGLSKEDMEDLAAYFSSQPGLTVLPRP